MNTSTQNIKGDPFSTQRLHLQLDALVSAYESKGIMASESLLPPLTTQELKDQCSWFPGILPQEIVALYSWRGGQIEDAWNSKHPFWFRDNTFSSIARAKDEYGSMMETYGSTPEDHELLKYSFPFASSDGGWYVIPTKRNELNPSLVHPVISVFQGIDIYFYTIHSMLDTCIDWVSHALYQRDTSLPEGIEMEIWRKHNPGIFQQT